MPVNEYGHDVDEDWQPGNPVLRGETQIPDEPAGVFGELDELPHRVRWRNGLTGEEPDPGYDPASDDLEVQL
jgi:hypothetical protein